MRAKGLKPLGNYHSHPNTPSRPSAEDIRLAFDPSASYMIVSLAGSEPVLKSFHIESGVSSEEEIEIL
jgi:proteasome lid subunit RPN8/RPN11